jgi:DNA-binding NtrC family response regulator
MPHKILIVDDDADLRQAMVEQLAPQEEFEIHRARKWYQGHAN